MSFFFFSRIPEAHASFEDQVSRKRLAVCCEIRRLKLPRFGGTGYLRERRTKKNVKN